MHYKYTVDVYRKSPIPRFEYTKYAKIRKSLVLYIFIYKYSIKEEGVYRR